MAWTSTDLDTVKAAIATATLRVRTSDGRMIEYRSMDELLAAKQEIERELAAASATKTSKVRRVVTRTGW
jgi:hypothetical protein